MSAPSSTVVVVSPPVVAAPAITRVVVAKRSLPAQATLSPDNVELRNVPSDSVQPNAVMSLGEVTGKVLVVPIAAGEQVLTHRLAAPGAQTEPPDVTLTCPGGQVAVTVEGANVRTGPSIAASVLEQAKYGTKLRVIGQQVDWLKVQLPNHREGWVQVNWVGQCEQPSVTAGPIRITAATIGPTNTKVGDTLDISVTVENTSDKPLQTMGPEPGFTYVQGQTYFTQQYPSEPGKWRVALQSAGLDATELPYRWGLGGELAPDASVTVTGHVKITQDFKTTKFWVSLVDEPRSVVQSTAGISLVTSLPENIAIVAVDAANSRRGPTPAPGGLPTRPFDWWP